MTKEKSVDDERILVNNKEIHRDDAEIGTEYYIMYVLLTLELFNKT